MRPYQEGDEDDICKLFETAFGDALSAERWYWQYRDNHTGRITITLTENTDGEIVGQYALRPVRMKVGDKSCLGTLSLDTMVHPDYRRQGMFTSLASQMYDVVTEQGIPLTYGFPNQNSYYGFIHKLEWVDLCGRIPLFVKILNVKTVLSKRIGNRLLLSIAAALGRVALNLFYSFQGEGELPADCEFKKISHFDGHFDDLWEEASSAYDILVVRDKTYLNWRYVENPTDEYTILTVERESKIVGYAVLKTEEKFGLKVGFIVDLLTIPDEPVIASGLISVAVKHFREERLDMVGCLMLEHTPYAESLRKNGFVIVPQKLFPQELYLGVRRHTDEYSEQFITNPENWFITWGDHDAI